MLGNNTNAIDSVEFFDVLTKKAIELKALVAQARSFVGESRLASNWCMCELSSLGDEIEEFKKKEQDAFVKTIEALNRQLQEINATMPPLKEEVVPPTVEQPPPHESLLRVKRELTNDCIWSHKEVVPPSKVVVFYAKRFYVTLCPEMIAEQLGTGLTEVYRMLEYISTDLLTVIKVKEMVFDTPKSGESLEEFLVNEVSKMFIDKFLFHVFMKHTFGFDGAKYVEYTEDEVQLYRLFARISLWVMQCGLL